MSRFGDATSVERIAADRFRIDLDAGFGFAQALNGGYLMAVLGRAAVEASAHAHPVSTAASFLRVAKAGPAEILVERRKSGRTTETARATLLQDDEPVVDALITTATLDPAAEPVWVGAPPEPALPPVGSCLSLDEPPKSTSPRKGAGTGVHPRDVGDRGFADRVDMLFDPSTMGWLDGRPSGRLEGRAWFRLRCGYQPDAYALALAVDALPPVALNVDAKGWSPTVELTWHLRAVPAPGWLAVLGSGRLSAGGWFDEEVEIWDSAGRLVAQARQLARTGRA
ncbi:thioesterase family protein [Actinomadura logoneensis]|uniref:Thioesterase family protein n=1 Tax=Actinomadura logoneensis TaxID=2293572 RepID=A0A372JP10_9ACTN|nr:thioesterase family protein [Actinomadura logoneensis]RFU41536.1 thioesterase family protein [Actinomadura logoneensis]